MSDTVTLICKVCENFAGSVSRYDSQFIGDAICFSCLPKSEQDEILKWEMENK